MWKVGTLNAEPMTARRMDANGKYGMESIDGAADRYEKDRVEDI